MPNQWKDSLERDLFDVLRKYRTNHMDDGFYLGAAAITVADAARQMVDEWETSSVLAEDEFYNNPGPRP